MKIEKTTVVLVAETNFKRTLNLFLIRPQQTEEGKWVWKKGAMSIYSSDKEKPAARYFVWTEDAQGKLRGYCQPIESRQEAIELHNRALIHLQSAQYREMHGTNIEKTQESALLTLGYIKYNHHVNGYVWITSPLTVR